MSEQTGVSKHTGVSKPASDCLIAGGSVGQTHLVPNLGLAAAAVSVVRTVGAAGLLKRICKINYNE